MSRGLCVLAVLAILVGGCASRGTVDRLESDVGRLRKELAEIRVAQEATSRGVGNLTSQLQSMDLPALGEEVARLKRRTDAAEMSLAATRSQLEALAPASGNASTPAPMPAPAPAGTTRGPAPLPPSSATPPALAPPPSGPAGMTPAPAPSDRAAISPPPAPAPPPAATMIPPLLSPTSAPPPAVIPPTAAVEKPRVTPPPAPGPPPPGVAPAPSGPASTPGVAGVNPARKAGGSPEQEYAAALATYRAREHGQAVIDFLDFIARYPKHPLAGNAQYWIGEAYWAQKDYRQALVEFEKVFAYGPQKAPDAQVKIGMCYLRLGDVARAQQAWQKVTNEYPKSESASLARSLMASNSAARR
jgi:tol-pal system protein YbgF